jgi:4'-phosphopantetheinyl transferase EntD
MLKYNADKTLINLLFPEDVITAEADPTVVREAFYPEEEAYVRNAVPKRRQEFAAGRLCARSALARFGVKNFPLLAGKNREPVWPPGIVGSISHTDRYCGVAIAWKTKFESLGLDVELARIIDEYYWKKICTRKELAWITSLPSDRRQENAALIFSAKECLYKCQYAISKKWLNFHAVMITVNPDIGEFEAIFAVNIDSSFKRGTCLKGRYLFYHGYVFTGISIPKLRN